MRIINRPYTMKETNRDIINYLLQDENLLGKKFEYKKVFNETGNNILIILIHDYRYSEFDKVKLLIEYTGSSTIIEYQPYLLSKNRTYQFYEIYDLCKEQPYIIHKLNKEDN